MVRTAIVVLILLWIVPISWFIANQGLLNDIFEKIESFRSMITKAFGLNRHEYVGLVQRVTQMLYNISKLIEHYTELVEELNIENMSKIGSVQRKLEELTKELALYREELNQILTTLKKSGNVSLEEIRSKLNKINESLARIYKELQTIEVLVKNVSTT